MEILDLLDRPIAFHRAFARLAGSVHAGLLLSQAVYWSRRTSDRDGWFYKTQAEWTEETCLTRREQETARAALRKLQHNSCPLWLEERRGVPARMFFRIDSAILVQLLSQIRQSSLAESAKLDCTNQPHWHGGNRQTITETTRDYTETTPTFFDNRAPRESKKKRGGKFSFDFSFEALAGLFTESEHAWLVEHCPSIETESASRAFLTYHSEKGTRFRSSRAVLAAWRGWMIRAEGRLGSARKNPMAGDSGANSDVEGMRLAGIIE